MNTDRRPGSRLPDDPAYWQGLAARSIDAALDSRDADDVPHGALVSETRSAAPTVASPWWGGLAEAAYMLAASALLALVGGSLLLAERSPVTTTETHALMDAIAPDDDLLASLMDADAPPPAMAMLRVVARREVER